MNFKKSFFIAIVSIFLSSFQVFTQTMNITYNIPMFSHNGSFSVNLGSRLNKSTNESETIINVMNSKGEIVKVIDKEKIDRMINIIKEKTKTASLDAHNNNQILANIEKVIANLESLKMRFSNSKPLESVLQKSKNTKSVTSSLQWNYTIQTIRDVSIPMNGNLDW